MTSNVGTTPKTTRRRASNARGEAKRTQILEIAMTHFGDSGYRGASTAAIAAEAGISDPGLLHHFQSKAGLLTALLEQHLGRDDELLSIAINAQGTELLSRLADLISENEEKRDEVLLFSVLLAESVSSGHPTHDYFVRRFQHARSILSGYLSDARSRGVLRAEVDPTGLATALLALMDGLQYQWLLDDSVDMRRGFEAVTSLLASAMVASPTERNGEDS